MATGKAAAPATKGDLEVVRKDLRAEITSVRTELRGEIAAVRTELRGEIAAVRTQLKASINKVAAEVVKTQAELREVRQTMATKDDVSRILNAIDAFAQKGQSYDQKSLSHGAILTDHEDKLRDHGRRLTTLEAKS